MMYLDPVPPDFRNTTQKRTRARTHNIKVHDTTVNVRVFTLIEKHESFLGSKYE